MQQDGFARGSRYCPPGVAGQTRIHEVPPLSEENLEEQLNSLLLDTTANDEPVAGTHSVEHPSGGLNALEQALQDHLNKEKGYDKSPQVDTSDYA